MHPQAFIYQHFAVWKSRVDRAAPAVRDLWGNADPGNMHNRRGRAPVDGFGFSGSIPENRRSGCGKPDRFFASLRPS
jgi:hypothetical protein